MEISQLLDEFAAHLAANNRRARTIDWYRYEVQLFVAWLERSGLHRSNWLRRAVIERYLAECRDQRNNGEATVATHYRGLRGWFKWLTAAGYIAASPMAGMPEPAVRDRPPRRAELAEYDRLISSLPAEHWIDLRDRLLIHVLFLAGARVGEALTLTADDFRLPQKLLHVTGKTGERLVPLLPAVERAFVAYLYNRPPARVPQLFVAATVARTPRDTVLNPNGVWQMLARRCERAGVRRLNPHAFRHGLAMHLLNAGGDMSLVQKILGHAQISTTAQYYAEWLTDGLVREFSAKMGKVGR